EAGGPPALEVLGVRRDDRGGGCLDRVGDGQQGVAFLGVAQALHVASGLLREQHAVAGGRRGGGGHVASLSAGRELETVRSGPVPAGQAGSGLGANHVPISSPARARPTRSALVTRTPTPDAAASRAADTLVAAPPVPTLLTTTEPNSKPCRSSPYAMRWMGRAPGS